MDPRQGKPSGSSFHQLVRCPGQKQLIAAVQDQLVTEPDADAARGTRLHTALRDDNPVGLSEDELADYKLAQEHIASVVSMWQSKTSCYDVKELPREERDWYNAPHTLAPLISGEMDRRYLGTMDLALHPRVKTMLILDTKFGWLTYTPPARESWQLRVYSVIEWYNTNDLHSIWVALVKPKSKADPVDWVEYRPVDLAESEKAMLFHLWEASQPGAQRIAGRHCRFCPAKAFCPEAGAYHLLPSVLAKENGNLDIAGRVAAMTPTDLVRVWESMPVINKIADEVKGRLQRMTDEELKGLGMGRTKGKNLDPIVNAGGAFLTLNEKGITPPEFWPLVSISKTELVKTLRARFNLTSDKEAREWIARELAPFIQKKQSAPGLEKL